MPVEFRLEPTGSFSDTARLSMMYDGSGRRISKTLLTKPATATSWDTVKVTHYTGIGTEIREYRPRNFVRYTDSAGVEHCVSANPDYGGNASTACPLPDTVKAVIPLPQGLGRYALQDVGQVDESGAPQAFEWYLKNHLGSTMVVYGTGFPDPLGISPDGELRAAYDYRSFGEQLDLLVFTRKVTENFTGKELDDETELDYFGARYLDPMLGLWISVDPARQFASPYLYAGNGYNPVNVIDPDGNIVIAQTKQDKRIYAQFTKNLNPEQAERLRAIEQDKKFVMVFHGVDDFIEFQNNPYDPNRKQYAKGYADPQDGYVYVEVCYTCEGSQGTFAHEAAGHGRQVYDFMKGGRITGPHTWEDAKKWTEDNKMELEKDAFEVQGTPKTDQELKDMGY